MSTETKKFSDKFLFIQIWTYVSEHMAIFLGVIVFLILNVTLGVSGPLFFNYILENIEKGITEGNEGNIQLAIIGYVTFSLLGWVFGSIQFMQVAKLNARVIRDIRISSFSSLIDNKISFFDTQKSGDLTSRIVNDTKELSESGRDIAWVLTSFFRIIVVLAIFLYYSLTIALAALAFLPIIMLIAVLLGKYQRKVSKIWRTKFGEVNARFSEIMSKIQISKAFAREEENLSRFKEINEGTYEASKKRGLAIFIYWPITDLLKHLLLILILVVGISQVQLGMPIATLVLFLILLNYFYWPLITIANNYHRFQGAFASFERIANISLDAQLIETNPDSQDVYISDSFTGDICFKNVNFSYTEDERVLHDINFDIKPGERVAIVGPTGAGKSTLSSLLMRFYNIESGEITLDGVDIRNYNLTNYRKHIGLVSQRVLLFKGTIRENLTISNPDVSDEFLWGILDKVQSREFIELLPDGLDTIVEENGKNLSVGQRQMISFARALISDPKILILDEATSAVDLFTESKIQDAINILLEERTSISIAHRLTTILKSDKIIVLDKGRIVQMGHHDELVDQEGLYQKLYQLYLSTQSAKYLEKIKT